MIDSTLAVSEPAMLMVRTLPAMLALAPSEPVEPATLGVPLKVTVPPGAEGAMVTVNEPEALASDAAAPAP